MPDLSKALNLKSFIMKTVSDPAATHEPKGQWLPPKEGRSEWLFIHPDGRREYESVQEHQKRNRGGEGTEKKPPKKSAKGSLGEGEVQQKVTEQLQAMKKLKARYDPSDLSGATISAARAAKRDGKTYVVYLGTSYGHGVWRIGTESDATSRINNQSNAPLYSVSPDLTVRKHPPLGEEK